MVVADGKFLVVENYLEAVGVMTAFKAGVGLSCVRRPLPNTVVCRECFGAEVDEDAAGAEVVNRRMSN